jgi:hypothetical protein
MQVEFDTYFSSRPVRLLFCVTDDRVKDKRNYQIL